jgi:hypothetical protein
VRLTSGTPVDIGDGLSGWAVYRYHGDSKIELERLRGQGRKDFKIVDADRVREARQ